MFTFIKIFENISKKKKASLYIYFYQSQNKHIFADFRLQLHLILGLPVRRGSFGIFNSCFCKDHIMSLDKALTHNLMLESKFKGLTAWLSMDLVAWLRRNLRSISVIEGKMFTINQRQYQLQSTKPLLPSNSWRTSMILCSKWHCIAPNTLRPMPTISSRLNLAK